jgi:rod shape-determining protein MreC
MGNIFAFLSKYHRLFLFTILEIICLSLVVNFNKGQHSTFFAWAYDTKDRMYKTYDDVNLYFHLQKVNDSLSAENARLRASLKSAKYFDTAKTRPVVDTTNKQRYTFTSANVINNTVTKRDNFLTLDIGENRGVSRHLGVVSTAGIVGITLDVSQHFTTVLSVLHKDFTVSAEIAEMKEIGSVVWDGTNSEIVILKDIPQHIHIKKGMHVVTSPYSNVFPQNTPIGIIQSFEVKPGDAFYTIYVRLASDIRDVRQVYIVNNLFKEEQDTVEQKEVTP